jgi:hypothetical protein
MKWFINRGEIKRDRERETRNRSSMFRYFKKEQTRRELPRARREGQHQVQIEVWKQVPFSRCVKNDFRNSDFFLLQVKNTITLLQSYDWKIKLHEATLEQICSQTGLRYFVNTHD